MKTQTEGKAEQMFKNFGKKIDAFIADFKGSTDNLRKEEVEPRVEELKHSYEKLEAQAKEFKENNKEKWDEVEKELKEAGKSLKNALETAFSKK